MNTKQNNAERILTNFSAGPGAIPTVVLERFADTLLNYRNSGYSIVEASHRGKLYSTLQEETGGQLADTLNLPPGYQVLFLSGGASMQFSLIPYNLANAARGGSYLLAGAWGKKAYDSAVTAAGSTGNGAASPPPVATATAPPTIAYDGNSNGAGYTTLPDWKEVSPLADAAYLHVTSNETINGLQWHTWPTAPPAAPLIADMSSDLGARPIPAHLFDGIYASAQKNLGVAGVTVVILSPRLLEQAGENGAGLPPAMSYANHAAKQSLYNTPPGIAIYMLKLILEWIAEQGGVEALQTRNAQKAEYIYRTIDQSGGFYQNTISPEHRSHMNAIFTLPSGELTKRFLAGAAEENIIGINGHRSVGGCRVSLYNAITLEGTEIVGAYMRDFAAANG